MPKIVLIMRERRENAVRPPRTIVTACVLAAALLVAGCGGRTVSRPVAQAVLQPLAAEGPDPFTASTATVPLAVTRSAQATPPAQNSPLPGVGPAAPAGPRTVSGGTPGLYGGAARVGSCDVERQIGYLTADPARERAFARAEGIPEASVPGYLRRLTPVVLRADTRVTNHGYRDGGAARFQSVLQAGTAVLVDDRGLPRVRCACGNPLRPPAAQEGAASMARHTGGGGAWPGYRPAEVVVVTPAPRAVTSITIVDVQSHGWVERPIGHDVGRDRLVSAPGG